MSDSLQKTVGLLGELVSFESVSALSNLDLIGYVAAYLGDLGVPVLLSHDDSGEKANLFATIGPETDEGIMLSGHTDVVPVDDQEWNSPPFEMTSQNGNLIGRGTADMKGFLACALAMVPDFLAADLKRPLHLAFTFDEEIGCLGAPILLEQIKAIPVKPAIAIVGEPTDLQIVAAHKGGFEMTTSITGLEGHASDPRRGSNAVEFAIRYVEHLRQVSAELERQAKADSLFDPPWTTINVGRIEGGTARNIIAGHCTFDWELRPMPGDDGEAIIAGIRDYADNELLPQMRKAAPNARIETRIAAGLPGLDFRPDSQAVGLIRALTGMEGAHAVAFGSDAGHFQHAGIATVLYGPGSIDQAHKPDEFIAVSQLEACLNFLGRLRNWMTGPEQGGGA